MSTMYLEPPFSMTCSVIRSMAVDRKNTSTYYVSEEQYPEDHYPQYCTSYFMLYHIDSVAKLLAAYQRDINSKSIHLFTVYLGILAKSYGMNINDGRMLRYSPHKKSSFITLRPFLYL